jgi:hypothetical protein
MHPEHFDQLVLVQVRDLLLPESGISVSMSSRNDETDASPRMTSTMDFCLLLFLTNLA